MQAYRQETVIQHDGTLTLRDLPRRQRRLVEAWAELHAEELALAWQALQAGQLPETIDPLH